MWPWPSHGAPTDSTPPITMPHQERTSVEEEGRCVVTRIAYVDRAQHSEIRRYMLGQGMQH